MKKILNFVLVSIFAVFFSIAIINTATAEDSLPATTGKTVSAQKLTEAKLKVCQNKEAAIQKRNTQLNKTAETMMTKFDGIATKVETYYTSKVVPSGKTVSNYDALVAEIATKKSAVRTDLTKANTDATAFKCSGDNPKAQLILFRTDMQKVKQDLKDYRTSIKTLIVAVRSVTGTTESTSGSTAN